MTITELESRFRPLEAAVVAFRARHDRLLHAAQDVVAKTITEHRDGRFFCDECVNFIDDGEGHHAECRTSALIAAIAECEGA